MPEELSNAEVALLCDIGERDPATFTQDQRRDAEALLAKGYLVRTESRLKLTALAIAYLSARGAGINEA